MLDVVSGDLLQANVEALVNTVNCVGVMGKGVALQFKQAFPANFLAYEKACRADRVKLGEVFVFDTGSMMNPRWIINFPTKGHWKARSRLSDIQSGLQSLKQVIKENGIRSVALPPLGCGNGGLAWSDVEPVIKQAFEDFAAVHILLFSPTGAPDPENMRVGTPRPPMTRARAILLKVLGLYGAVGYRHRMLEVQKLSYFLQEAGEPLQLRFEKYHYGPYAENLNHVLQRLEGHFIRGYGDRSRDAKIHVLADAETEADTFLSEDKFARSRLERVARAIEGFETPYGLELLATVHWVAKADQAAQLDPSRAIARVKEWSASKARVMKEHHIELAWLHLTQHGWIGSPASDYV